jgi:hypothetical protein
MTALALANALDAAPVVCGRLDALGSSSGGGGHSSPPHADSANSNTNRKKACLLGRVRIILDYR